MKDIPLFTYDVFHFGMVIGLKDSNVTIYANEACGFKDVLLFTLEISDVSRSYDTAKSLKVLML